MGRKSTMAILYDESRYMNRVPELSGQFQAPCIPGNM